MFSKKFPSVFARRLFPLFVVLVSWIVLGSEPLHAQELEIDWLEGPVEARLGSQAVLDLGPGYVFADAEDTRALMEVLGNPPSDRELGLVMSSADESDWFLVFEYAPTGFIRDDDKDDIDKDALFESISAATEAANQYRIEHGFTPLHVIGWAEEPHYNEASHNLVWALRAASEGEAPTVNYNVRLLGRQGYTSVTLVTDPAGFAAHRSEVEEVLAGFRYLEGRRYADFRSGDKIAEYGLTALVAGGAGAAAVKLGLFAKLGQLLAKGWKILALALAGLLGSIRKFFRRENPSASLEP